MKKTKLSFEKTLQLISQIPQGFNSEGLEKVIIFRKRKILASESIP